MQTASGQHLIVHRLPFFTFLRDCRFALGLRQRLVVLDGRENLFNIATEHDVCTATGHVGGNGNHPRLTGLDNNFRLTGMLLGVEHLMRHFFLVEQAGKQFGGLDRSRTDQHRLATFGAILDVGNDRRIFLTGRLEDLIVHVLANHRPMRRNDHGF